ncbi:unnamed protein product [Colias eurytheme]|nr:unnamed protein product [Colias eurytheme]
MPGIYSGILTVIFAAVATKETYGKELHDVFEAIHEDGTGRTASEQALNQFLALIVTLAVSFVGGFITGLIAKLPFLEPLKDTEEYNDEVNWELP